MNVLSQMLLADPVAPVAIWLVLMFVSLPALLVLASPRSMRHPRMAVLQVLGAAQRYQQDRDRERDEAVEAARYAEEVRVAARRAQEAAQRWQDLWRQAERRADDAWAAWQEAEQRLRRARTAAVFATPATPRTAAEYADRERFLHRAVREAVERGDLPSTAPAAAAAGRDGWDARLHPVEQELVLLRAAACHREQLHRRAAATERTAWHDAQLAASTRDSLRREADVAEARAAAVRHHLPKQQGRPVAAGRRSWVQRPA